MFISCSLVPLFLSAKVQLRATTRCAEQKCCCGSSNAPPVAWERGNVLIILSTPQKQNFCATFSQKKHVVVPGGRIRSQLQTHCSFLSDAAIKTGEFISVCIDSSSTVQNDGLQKNYPSIQFSIHPNGRLIAFYFSIVPLFPFKTEPGSIHNRVLCGQKQTAASLFSKWTSVWEHSLSLAPAKPPLRFSFKTFHNRTLFPCVRSNRKTANAQKKVPLFTKITPAGLSSITF